MSGPKDLLQSSPVPCCYKVGDPVIYTNDAGLKFPMFVVGFSKPERGYLRGGFIHLAGKMNGDGSAWWYPHPPEEIARRPIA